MEGIPRNDAEIKRPSVLTSNLVLTLGFIAAAAMSVLSGCRKRETDPDADKRKGTIHYNCSNYGNYVHKQSRTAFNITINSVLDGIHCFSYLEDISKLKKPITIDVKCNKKKGNKLNKKQTIKGVNIQFRGENIDCMAK